MIWSYVHFISFLFLAGLLHHWKLKVFLFFSFCFSGFLNERGGHCKRMILVSFKVMHKVIWENECKLNLSLMVFCMSSTYKDKERNFIDLSGHGKIIRPHLYLQLRSKTSSQVVILLTFATENNTFPVVFFSSPIVMFWRNLYFHY